MMKQFLRVKQIADQKFQREKSNSILTEELNAAEKRVDLIKESCYATGKKLSACIHRLGIATDSSSDKRNGTKKIPEAALAQCMEEWGFSLGESSILGLTLVDYAHIQDTLANDLVTYTLQVGDNVVEPLQNILNTDISKILKLRKQLSKLTSEMDSAKSRYQNALKNSQQTTGNGAASAAAKAQLLKEEAEDIVSRVDQCRDSLTAEMFNLVSREPEMSHLFVKLCQLQLEYHRKAFFMLESALPELEAQIKCCPYQPVFGIPLQEHLRVTKREIAVVIETCICWLLESAMEEEGLFRIGGSMIKIKKMKSAFDSSFQHLIEDEKDPHNIAGVLKLYLRSLPEPLLTYKLYDQWMQAAMEADHDTRLKLLWGVVNSLPEANFKNLRYLIKFLSKICQNSDVNKMSIQNIAIVIGPNLLWPPTDESAFGMNMTATNLHSSIVDLLITYAEWFFPGEWECYVSTPTTPRHIEGFPLPALSQTNLFTNGNDSALESMSSSPTNSSSPKSPSPRVPLRPRKKAAPKAPQSFKNQITRSQSCSGFQAVNAVNKSKVTETRRISNLSVSHENLLSVNYHDAVFEDPVKASHINGAQAVPAVFPRTKPPRQPRNGLQQIRQSLPPVVERIRRPVERPSVPPPERPDSFCKSESVGSEDMPTSFHKTESVNSDNAPIYSYKSESVSSPYHAPNYFYKSDSVSSEDTPNYLHQSGSVSSGDVPDERVVDLEDISISFESSGSESYNECHMSFADDSDNEDSYLKQDHQVTETSPFQNINNVGIISASVQSVAKVTKSFIENDTHISNEEKHNLSGPISNGHTELEDTGKICGPEEDMDDYSSTCHFTGGTPTFFEHYGDDKRQSNTVWFENSDANQISEVENFRTIIEVGSSKQTFSKTTVKGNAIKLRVNSETQDTKL